MFSSARRRLVCFPHAREPSSSTTCSHHCDFCGALLLAGTILYKSQFGRPATRTMEFLAG
jgi:hypothetical protein